jgi:hypothetical protein
LLAFSCRPASTRPFSFPLTPRPPPPPSLNSGSKSACERQRSRERGAGLAKASWSTRSRNFAPLAPSAQCSSCTTRRDECEPDHAPSKRKTSCSSARSLSTSMYAIRGDRRGLPDALMSPSDLASRGNFVRRSLQKRRRRRESRPLSGGNSQGCCLPNALFPASQAPIDLFPRKKKRGGKKGDSFRSNYK